MNKQAYGTWASPISAETVTQSGVQLGAVAYQDGAAFWAETRPDDENRCTIVKSSPAKKPVDLFGAPFNTRTRVHEYGGGSWWVDATYLYFVHWDDQRLYRVNHLDTDQRQDPVPLTPVPAVKHAHRYADGCVSPDGNYIVCVRERHNDEPESPVNEIVVIANTANQQRQSCVTIVGGSADGVDFYSTPRLSPDASQLSWVQWSHPQMPWDGTQLMVADVQADFSLKNTRLIAGSDTESVMGALWAADGRLVYASDESGWWNLYQYTPTSQQYKQLTQFDDREVGTPAWSFGTQRFVELRGVASDFALLVTIAASDQLYLLDESGNTALLKTSFCSFASIAADDEGGVIMHAQSANLPACIAGHTCRLNDNAKLLKPAESLKIDDQWLCVPQAIEFASGARQAHAFFYPPAGQDLAGLDNELPPLIVMGHGGPTGHSTPSLNLSIQYWTSRGIAVVDVNYGGSSGFGREYRRLLNGHWGVVDVEDCVAATAYLAQKGLVDAQRMVIRGGSAGGLTVLRALQTSELFAGGTSLYGVTDLEMLAGDTHKFESRYLDGLLGGPYPEHKATYVARSPIHHADKLSCPILVLQGDEDKIVPPNQSAAIIDAAAAKGLPHAYVLFEGEQHGFRITKNSIRALKLELWFYGSVLQFDPADNISAPVEAVGLAS